MYGPVPVTIVVVALPVHPPLQLTLVCVPESVSVPDEPTVTATVVAGEQEIASLTVQV